MSDSLQNSLVFLASTIGIYYALVILGEAIKIFMYIHSIFKRPEDDKMLRDLINALQQKPRDPQDGQ